ncbi:uncharacterized protein MEPE_04279 [Melanopsichium pennsylvanicum]|uniref:Uncharacterized protein n=1 Tax=Melanopsichium pennsylvanicum TaxID=63383 RepID=A0AAJ4XNJ9_9BASI|nr:uncharacterized protein MEPE_04279 [Melanopsichium pennsylvanicum]
MCPDLALIVSLLLLCMLLVEREASRCRRLFRPALFFAEIAVPLTLFFTLTLISIRFQMFHAIFEIGHSTALLDEAKPVRLITHFTYYTDNNFKSRLAGLCYIWNNGIHGKKSHGSPIELSPCGTYVSQMGKPAMRRCASGQEFIGVSKSYADVKSP